MVFATLRLLSILCFRFLGVMVFIFSKKRRAVALKNINLCFPSQQKEDNRKNKKIVKKSFMLLGHALSDFLLIRFYKKRFLDNCFKIKNIDVLKTMHAQGRGVILSTAHFGSWELAAHYLALNGFKFLILYKPMKHSNCLEKFVKKNRELSGNILIPKEGSLLTLFRHLKKGGIVLLATDQHCYPPDGIEAPLFGKMVRSHSAFIRLSLKTGSPILTGFSKIKDLFNYELELTDIIDPIDFKYSSNAENEMLKRSNQSLESAIRKSPANWMWSHRRFKGILNY